ncbi:Casein kinase II regulatory subunit family protein [Histomonas meleagridis]|uniref:Casein kinase II regulatory subunit family protein n=1 Tax=Histomonas meleagridis TaxID=135588 RepID=UPI00355A1D6F|nr:Casein kinase II regulatory subunit family protein [Histomonas meleagridis]KAH0803783.1 Casein kinase II regulatory subunit family protein [Histomonas meleagridis]
MSHCSRTWVDWFTSQPQGRYFTKIPLSFLQDSFNLYGLRQQVGSQYKFALEMIRSPYYAQEDPARPAEWPINLENSAIKLYGLLHSRYLLTASALKEMHKKYQHHEFETCPRVNCNGFQCLPFGQYEEPNRATLQMFCPCCEETYAPSEGFCKSIDGAYFGPSWVLLFLQNYTEITKNKKMIQTDVRLFGFKIDPEDNGDN